MAFYVSGTTAGLLLPSKTRETLQEVLAVDSDVLYGMIERNPQSIKLQDNEAVYDLREVLLYII